MLFDIKPLDTQTLHDSSVWHIYTDQLGWFKGLMSAYMQGLAPIKDLGQTFSCFNLWPAFVFFFTANLVF